MNDDPSELLEMAAILSEDVDVAQEKLDTPEDSPFWRRIFAHAVFTQAEGMCTFMRQQGFARCTQDFPNGGISIGEIAVYAGEEYRVSETGEIRRKDMNLQFIPNLFLSLKAWAFALDSDHVPGKGDEWHRVKSARDVRNRITHPAKREDLNISDDEIGDIVFFQHRFLRHVTEISGMNFDGLDNED